MKRYLALILALLMIFALFAACGKKADKDAAGSSGDKEDTSETALTKDDVNPSDKQLRVTFSQEPNSWQQLAMSVASTNAALQTDTLYDTLINYDSTTGELIPNLATEWHWENDKTLRLKLREDVTSINGDPFTADDVVFCVKTGCADANLSSYYSSILDPDNTKTVDKYTVDIATKNVYPFLPLDLTHNAYQMSVEASVTAAGGLEATKTNPICATGPYKLVEHQSGQYAKFERRDDYWGVPPYYKTVYTYFVSDPETRGLGLESGDYDVVTKPSSSLCQNLGSKPGFQVRYVKTEACVLMPINTDREPMNVKEVRQAMAMAINYPAILQVTVGEHGEVMDSPYSSQHQGYHPIDTSKPCYLGKYDPEGAKKKLTEAGYPDGFNFSISYRTTDSNWVKSAEIVRNNLQDIGIKTELIQVEGAAFYTISESGDFDSVIWTNSNPNPRRMIQVIDSRYTQCNCGSGWNNDDYRALFDKAITEVDDAKRDDYFKQINDILRDECPILPLVFAYNATIMIDSIANFTTDSYGNVRITTLYESDYLK